VRHIAQRGVRITSSDPIDLFALRMDMARPAVQDARFREAVSAAIDRASIADVVLQRQGVQAGSLLPNWLSGYAFLFPSAMNLPRSKQLLSATGRQFLAQRRLCWSMIPPTRNRALWLSAWPSI